jgi:N6-adenosine-specific RNA methylase IME4
MTGPAIPPQAGAYRAIYADPPWRFSTYSDKGKGRSAEAHYDCMSLPEIKAMPVRDWAAPDAVLFLWTTDPMLQHGLEVLAAWGFKYKTVAFYWVKLNKGQGGMFLTPRDFFTGMGFWTRANPELCLLGTRGHPRRRNGDVAKLLLAPRREHSRKPEAAYERIERLVDGPYLELFARAGKTGWDQLGDQSALFDAGSVRTRRRPSSGPASEPGN